MNKNTNTIYKYKYKYRFKYNRPNLMYKHTKYFFLSFLSSNVDVVLRHKTAFMFSISNTRKWMNTDDVQGGFLTGPPLKVPSTTKLI